MRIALAILIFACCLAAAPKKPKELAPNPFPAFSCVLRYENDSAFWIGELEGKRGIDRPEYRDATCGPKWESKLHNAGCALYAPDYFCICNEFGNLPPLKP